VGTGDGGAGAGTLTGERPATQPRADAGDRQVRRARGLPGGRAVVGALLIAAAAVGVTSAYLSATADPTTAYVVAATTVEPGTRFETLEQVQATFGQALVELTPSLAERAIPATSLASLVGQVVIAPLERGDLLTRTVVLDDGQVAPAQTMSFAIARTDAVGGVLRPGERIDVLATYGSSDGAYTSFVVRGVPLLRLTAPDGGELGAAGELVLTVAVTSLDDVLALGHAINTADVFVTRSTSSPGDADAAPGAYRPSPDGVGPVPDPAAPGGPSDLGGSEAAATDANPSTDE
jgi:Flp pilus assembly protein CpaB